MDPTNREIKPQSKVHSAFATAFGLFTLISVSGNLTTAWILDFFARGKDLQFVACPFFGLLLAQFASLAMWLVLGTWALRNRIGIVGTIVFVLALALIVGTQVWPGMPLAAAYVMIVSGFVLTFLAAGTFALVIRASQLQLVDGLGATRSSNHSEKQFGVGYLLFLMTVVAVFIALFKVAVPKNSDAWIGLPEYVSLFSWFLLLAISMGLLAWIVCMVLLQKPSVMAILSLIASVIIGPFGFQGVASWILVGRMAVNCGNPSHLAIAYLICAGILVGLVMVLSVVRLLGYRLCEQGKN